MSVQELIDYLSELDPEADVYKYVGSGPHRWFDEGEFATLDVFTALSREAPWGGYVWEVGDFPGYDVFIG